VQILPYEEQAADRWDEFTSCAYSATFLHTRRFLSYHGSRYKDTSLFIQDEDGRLLGLLPAAVDPVNDLQVISDPGITYGGILQAGKLRGEKMLEAFESVKSHFAMRGFELLKYKAVPYIYHRVSASDDLYALFRLGAARYRCDLSCAIDLANRPMPSQRRSRGMRKALKNGVVIEEGTRFVAALWTVLEENLTREHDTKPVHSVADIRKLHSLFPDKIEFVVASMDAAVIAGVVLFSSPQVVHAQYIASTLDGYRMCALDAVLEHCITKAKQRGARYFDFGISNEEAGRYLNAGLYQFKAEFGGGGVAHEFYELDLKA